jgi:hypothetical protein
MKIQYMKFLLKSTYFHGNEEFYKKKKRRRIFVRDKETFEVNIVNKLDLG